MGIMKFNHAASHEQVADMGWSCRSDGRWVKHILLPRLMQAIATALVLASLCFAFVHALPGDTALRIAAARAGEGTTPPADSNGSSEYRVHLAQVLTRRALDAI